MIENNSPLPRHMPALDGLRGIAILMVIATHAGGNWGAALGLYQTANGATHEAIYPHWMHLIAGGGSQGVQLFFLISAFTLTCRAMTQTDDLRGYALRRMARIVPAYYLAALFYTVIAGLSPRLFAPDSAGIVHFVPTGLFDYQWRRGALIGEAPGAWSIYCEMAFYVLLPLILYLTDRRIWRALLLAAVATLWAMLHTRSLVIDARWNFATYIDPLIQAPVFLYGICAALIAMRCNSFAAPGLALTLLSIAVFIWPQMETKDAYFPHHLSFALIAAIAVGLSALTSPKILTCKAMRRLGEVSYSMYLIHFMLLAPAFILAARWMPSNDWRTIMLRYAIIVGGSFALACITFRYVEQPFIGWAARISARWQAASPGRD